MPGLFNKKILKQRIKNYSVDNIERKVNQIKNWQKNLADIKGLNEVELQNAFMGAIFEDILGYEDAPQKDKSTLKSQASTDVDATRPDGIIGFYDKTKRKEEDHRAVIELKGPQIPLEKDQKRKGTTYRSPVDQGFSYTNKLDKCRWVIVSNFTEIRLYQVGRSKEYYEIFYLNELDDIEEFKRFHYLLSKNNLISKDGKSQTLQLTEKTQKRHEDISVEFYNLYKNARINLFGHLKENNENIDFEVLLEKAQKFLDRIIFICFCEDKGLLPNDLLHNAIKQAKNSFYSGDTRIWDQIRGVFKAIDKGMPNKNINAYNGGLFEFDKVLDVLVIKDDFFDVIYDFSDYDFDSDVDVNILGHIFEQSISDIEKLKSDIKDNEFDKNESRRKKEGIYYTPQYITSYIVENAVGGYLEDIKEDMGYYDLPDIEKAGSDSWQTRYTNQHLKFYDNYEEKLKEIKVLDPACGSGAFLNQAFDYLLQEHQWLNKQRDLLKGGQSSIYALEGVQRNILKNNLYGVDLNEESVEITKLSLWLKTANKNKPLTNLDDNIKCGNSLIDDPEVADDKAFDWKEEFSDIMVRGGFDVVIGNPPYVLFQNIGDNSSVIEYIKNNYESASYKIDTYPLFIELGIKLCRKNGYISFITPNTFLKNKFSKDIRRFIVENTSVVKIVNFFTKIFEDASVDTVIFSLVKDIKNNQIIKVVDFDGEVFDIEFADSRTFKQKNIKPNDYFFNLDITDSDYKVLNKIKSNKKTFGDLGRAYFGIQTFDREKYVSNKRINGYYKPVVDGGNIFRYYLSPPTEYVEFLKENVKSGGNKKVYHSKRVLVRQIGKYPKGAYSPPGIFTLNTVYNLFLKDNNINIKYLLGIINSNVVQYFWQLKYYDKKATFPKIKKAGLENIPIQLIPLNKQKAMVRKVDNMINIYKKQKQFKNITFYDYLSKYTSQFGLILDEIIEHSNFNNKIYSGRARKVRYFTVNINTNIITLYSEKASNGKYELLKFEEDNKYKRRFLKYYLEYLTEEQLEEIDDKYEGNLLDKVLQIDIPDYNKEHVVKKVVNEWENLQQEIEDLEDEIEKTDNEIDQMVYELYDLTDEDIKIVEESLGNK